MKFVVYREKINYNLLYTQKLSSVKCCLIEMILKNLKWEFLCNILNLLFYYPLL